MGGFWAFVLFAPLLRGGGKPFGRQRAWPPPPPRGGFWGFFFVGPLLGGGGKSFGPAGVGPPPRRPGANGPGGAPTTGPPRRSGHPIGPPRHVPLPVLTGPTREAARPRRG